MARNTSVTLGQHFEEFVTEKIMQGRFQTVSEVVRAGLRKLEEDESKLQALRENSSLVRTARLLRILMASNCLLICARNMPNDLGFFDQGFGSHRSGRNLAVYL